MRKISLFILFCFLFVFSVTSFVSAEPITVGTLATAAGAVLVAKDIASIENDGTRTMAGAAAGAVTGGAALIGITSFVVGSSAIIFAPLLAPAALTGAVVGGALAWWAGDD